MNTPTKIQRQKNSKEPPPTFELCRAPSKRRRPCKNLQKNMLTEKGQPHDVICSMEPSVHGLGKVSRRTQ